MPSSLLAAPLCATLAVLLAGCSRPPADISPTVKPMPAATSAVATANGAPVLSSTGYGPLRFGVTLAAVETQLGAKAQPLGENDPACSSVRLKALPGARFMVEKGVVTRADADPGSPNALGLAVGDTLARARQTVPGLQVGPHKYLPQGHYLTADSADGKAAIVLEEDGKVITAIRAGLRPAVDYVEVCL